MDAEPQTWEQFTAAIAADLGAVLRPELEAAGTTGCYVLTASECGHPDSRGFYGETAWWLAEVEREAIAGRWSGNAPAMILNDGLLMSEARGDFGRARPRAAAVAAHEAAHWMELPVLVKPVGAESTRAALRQRYHDQFAAPLPEDQLATHGEVFIRLTLHIAHRLRCRGWRIVNPFLFTPYPSFNRRIGVAPFIAAIGDEPERLAGVPISELRSIEPPESFRLLWDSVISARNKIRAEIEFWKGQAMTTNTAEVKSSKPGLAERLRDKKKAEAIAADDRFRELAIQDANGVELAEDEGERILNAAGKTWADLDAAVASVKKRREKRAKLDREGEIVRELLELHAERDAEDSRVGAIVKAFREFLTDRTARITALENERAGMGNIRRELVATAGEAAKARVAAAQEAEAEARQRCDWLRERLTENRDNLRGAQSELERVRNQRGDAIWIQQLEGEVKTRQAAIGTHDSELVTASARLRELQKATAEAAAMLLDPESF